MTTSFKSNDQVDLNLIYTIVKKPEVIEIVATQSYSQARI